MKKAPVGERFWRYVSKLGPKDCWVWTGSRFKAGYGMLHSKVGGQPYYAHRLSYEMHVDDVLPSDVVRHKCDNPPCVNPLHLLIGTHFDNHRDCVERGRFKNAPPMPGESNPNSKLTQESVRELRRLRKEGWRRKAIAEHLSISESAVKKVMSGATWKHVS